ncbi:MAG: AMP-binding protein [Planctomycetota bacterium]|jgi:fatty-acyl-CoA synthase
MSAEGKPWIDGLTYAEVLAQTVGLHGGRDAVVFPELGLRWTYADFQQEVRRFARALLAIGVQPGDKVGIWSTNWPEYILSQFGTAIFGAVLVNVNPAYRVHEFSYVLEQADIHTLLLTDTFKTSNYEAMMVGAVEELDRDSYESPLRSQKFPKLRQVISIKNNPSVPGIRPWEEFIQRADQVGEDHLDELSALVRPELPVNIQYTSGTTGNPKGATLSHRNLLMNAFYVGSRMRFSEQDRLCIPVPFYHCFGSVMGTLMCSVYGAAMVVPGESFKTDATLSAVQEESCTALYGVPTMFSAELHSDEFDKCDLSSLRTGIMAGSPCPIELMRQVTSKMHLSEITIAYGLTEASPVITQTETSEPLEIRVSTVGKPLPGLEVRIIDPVSGQELPDGEQGELCVRGHGVMLGYYNMPAETAKAISDDGWLRTGDLVIRTDSGHYRITGRHKDMLIRGGENIYPREIEEFLLTHPQVREVQVVGVPDKRFGEQVMAWIIPKEGVSLAADEIRQFCKGNIAHYKVPHYVEFVDRFPMTVTGKVQKFRLREMAVERYNLDFGGQNKIES